MSDYDEKKAYLEIFKRNAAIYEATPPRSFIQRAKLRKKLRYSYGDAVGKDNNVLMPLTAWEERREGFFDAIRDGWGRPFKRGWLFNTVATAFWLSVLTGFIWLVGWVIPWSSPPKPLPVGIQQRGYTFIIPPNYAATANYAKADGTELCYRLPEWTSRSGDVVARSNPQGGITIKCVIDQD